MDWDKFMTASIIALGLPPTAKSHAAAPNRTVQRPIKRVARKRRPGTAHAAGADTHEKQFQNAAQK